MPRQHQDKITIEQRRDLAGSPWQVNIIMADCVKVHVIDTPAELNRILMLPRGDAREGPRPSIKPDNLLV